MPGSNPNQARRHDQSRILLPESAAPARAGSIAARRLAHSFHAHEKFLSWDRPHDALHNQLSGIANAAAAEWRKSEQRGRASCSSNIAHRECPDCLAGGGVVETCQRAKSSSNLRGGGGKGLLNVPLAGLTPDVRTEAEFYMPTTGLVGHPIVLLHALVS